MSDLPPIGEEAEAQRVQPVMKWIWTGLGLLVVLLFVGWLAIGTGTFSGPSQSIVAPMEKPAHT